MAPSSKVEKTKQKSLMSYFAKGPQSSLSQSIQKTPAKDNGHASKSATARAVEIKESDTLQPEVFSSPVALSSTSSRGATTPPTSDPIDVDMSLLDEDDEVQIQAKPGRNKRKVIVESSDEEDATAAKLRKSSRRNSSPSLGPQRSAKKARVLEVVGDEEDEEGVGGADVSSFSQRLTRFMKSPKKSQKSRSQASDDDDFIVPSDSDIEVTSTKSSVRSSASSRTSVVSSDEDSGDEVKAKKKKTSASGVKRPGLGSGKKETSNSGSFSFLTAAEQREKGKKDGKKSADSPYSFLADIKDKDERRPGEPGYDPRTLYVPSKAWKEFTPFEKQFWEIKQNHYDTILFFQKGKFFELYEDDARIGHQEFDLKLTSRVKMSMVGVPEMSFNFWAAKFLGKGYKVGRVEQSETALGAEMRMAATKGKGKAPQEKEKEKIVRRELNKVYTNGTLLDPELLTDDQAGHCVAISELGAADGSDSSNKFGICVLDCSTSQFNLSAFEDDICRTKLETLMRQIRPKELLYKKTNLTVSTVRLLKSVLPAACLWTGLRDVEGFNYQETVEELKKLFPQDSNAIVDEEEDGPFPNSVPESIRQMASSTSAVESLGCMIWYLRQLNIDKDILSMKNFNIYDPMKKGEGLSLDGQTLAHIEVLMNNEGTEDGSLLKLLGRCITPFGKRLFRIWLCMPLRDIASINARLDAVQDILKHPTFEEDFTEIAKGLPDLERIVSRIHAKNCRVKDFLKVLRSFKNLSRGLNKLSDTSEAFESKTIFGLLRSAPDLLQNIKHVESMYQPTSEKESDELVPRTGKDEAYDKIMAEIDELEKYFEEELEKFEKKIKCKLAYWHSAVGNKEIYLVETPSSFKDVPNDWSKSGGTKAKTRWVVSSLQKKVRQLKEARENRGTAIKAFKFRLYAEFDAERSVWLRAIRIFSELDCLFSLAKASAAIGEPACRPEFIEGDNAWFDFEQLRHPTLCLTTTVKNFIPNDVKLGQDVGKISLLTGPNMAGKSTVMRMTATGIIMAQLGMLVPASRARLCPVDAIITRMGAYDNMFSNASTFKVELDECCKILRDATPKSFVILDELGRGTSTYDGMAIASAVLHQLATHTLALSFFATHYGSLTDDFLYHPNIRNMHMSTLVDDEKRDLVFLFKLVEGVAESSFGTHVANLAGVPIEVVERADTISKKFAEQFKERLQQKKKQDVSSRMSLFSQADFVYLFKLGTGQLQLPENTVRKQEILKRLKEQYRRRP